MSAMRSDRETAPAGHFYLRKSDGRPVPGIDQRPFSLEQIRRARRAGKLRLGPKWQVSVDGLNWQCVADTPRLKEGIEHDVFLSYANEEYAIAAEIKSYFKKEGIYAYVAKQDVGVSSRWPDALAEAIDGSLCVVLVASGLAYEKSWVQREITYALAKDKPLIAFRVDDVPKPRGVELSLSQVNWIEGDLSNSEWEDELPILTDAVLESFDGSPRRVFRLFYRLKNWLRKAGFNAIFSAIGALIALLVVLALVFVVCYALFFRYLPDIELLSYYLPPDPPTAALVEITHPESQASVSFYPFKRSQPDTTNAPAIAGLSIDKKVQLVLDMASSNRAQPWQFNGPVEADLRMARKQLQSLLDVKPEPGVPEALGLRVLLRLSAQNDEEAKRAASVLRKVVDAWRDRMGSASQESYVVVHVQREKCLFAWKDKTNVPDRGYYLWPKTGSLWNRSDVQGLGKELDRLFKGDAIRSSKLVLLCGETSNFFLWVAGSLSPAASTTTNCPRTVSLGMPTSCERLDAVFAPLASRNASRLNATPQFQLEFRADLNGGMAGDTVDDPALGTSSIWDSAVLLKDILKELLALGTNQSREVVILPFIE